MSEENLKPIMSSGVEILPDVQKLIEEIEALATQVDEHQDLFIQIFPAMLKAFNANKRKNSVLALHGKYANRLGGVHIRVFRQWWKSAENAKAN